MRRRTICVLCLVLAALSVSSFALPERAEATPVFDAVVTQINGSPITPVNVVSTVSASDVIRVELRVTLEPGDSVRAASIPMIFSNDALTLLGPGSSPGTFHVPCSTSGTPCSLATGADANSGAATFDSQAQGIVGAMGFFRFDASSVAAGTHSLGVVDFHVGRAPFSVRPFVQFPSVDGTFGADLTPVPFVIGQGVWAIIPEPSVGILVGLGLLGLSRVRGHTRL